MTIKEATSMNMLLAWLFDLPGPAGTVPGDHETMSAVVYLAKRSHTALGAGLGSGDAYYHWPRLAVSMAARRRGTGKHEEA